MKKRVCFVVSVPMTARAFLLEHMAALMDDYEVYLVSNFQGQSLDDMGLGIHVIDIPIVRSISLKEDLNALFKLYRLFKVEQFDVVHSVTPKAGLLAMLAAKVAGIRHRFHIFTGQVWATKRGALRMLLKFLDRVIAFCATDILVDSPSQLDFLIDQGVLSRQKAFVLGDGSISGVNTLRFQPNVFIKNTIRMHHNIPQDAFVFLFLGRLNYEKGIAELIDAFSRLNFLNKKAYLLVVGPEEDDVLKQQSALVQRLGLNFVRMGFTSEPEKYMAAADVFCLPSHREGFGTVILEAAAAGVPSIGSNIYGISDAIDDGKTGLLHEKCNVDDLYQKMSYLLDDRAFTASLGKNARCRVEDKFLTARIVGAMVAFYQKRL